MGDERSEQETMEGTEMESVLCFLRYRLLVWVSV